MPVGTPTQSKPLAPAPTEHEQIIARELDGVLCDGGGPCGSMPGEKWRGCPSWAYVQVRFLDADKITLGDLHLCCHHYAVNQIALELAVSLGRAGIIVDERERIYDGNERKDISA